MSYKITEESENIFLEIEKQHNVFLEGNILKILEANSEEFKNYIERSLSKDSENRKKRLEVTKKFQDQNKKLEQKAEENDRLMEELKEALEAAENAKAEAINDLDVIQRKSQFELIGDIVSYALYVIVGTGIITTILYIIAILYNSTETTLIGNTWSNLFGILLTNSFSIIGTIMGVKYANGNKSEKE